MTYRKVLQSYTLSKVYALYRASCPCRWQILRPEAPKHKRGSLPTWPRATTSTKIYFHTELYSRSKLILSSQIRSDILMNLKKKIKIKFTGISELDLSLQLTMIWCELKFMASSQRDKNPSIGRKEYLELLHSSSLLLVGGTAPPLIWPWTKVHIRSLWTGRKDQAQICLWTWSWTFLSDHDSAFPIWLSPYQLDWRTRRNPVLESTPVKLLISVWTHTNFYQTWPIDLYDTLF